MSTKSFVATVGLLAAIWLLGLNTTTVAESNASMMAAGDQVIISDDRFLIPSRITFDVSAFLRKQAPPLGALQISVSDGKPFMLADQIEALAYRYGIEPRVILTMLEIKGGLLTNPSTDPETLQWVMGKRETQKAGISAQLQWLAETLDGAFHMHYYNRGQEIVFADGSKVSASPKINSATYAIQYFLALGSTREKWAQWVGRDTGSFYATYERFFGSPIGPQTRMLIPKTFPSNMELRLPWRMNESWIFWSGPHRTNSRDSVLAAVDWGPEDIWCSPTNNRTSGTPVLASRGGTVLSASCNFVLIDHGNNWATGYFHLDNIQVRVNNPVSTGAILGYPSCLVGASCGWSGSSDRPHVHFDIRQNGVRRSIAGTVISGWTINAGSSERSGTMTRGSTTISLRQRVPSDNSSDPDDARLISSGQTLSGNISPAADQDLYYFDATAGQIVTIEMTKVSGNVDPFIEVYRPNGAYFDRDDDSAGFPNARLTRSLPDTGRYRIIARSYSTSQTGAYTIRVSVGSGDTDDHRFLSHNQQLNGTINPNNDEDTYYFSGVQGRIVSIRMNKSGGSLDSYLELYDPNGSLVGWNDDGGGWDTRNAWLVAILPRTGIYRVKARSYNHASSGAYTIRMRMVDANNYASGGGASSSSNENSSYQAYRAIDGDPGTRWSSRFSDPQWIQIDLRQNRTFDMVILRWEAAYARRYYIQVWTGSNWRNVAYISNGRGGAELIRFPRTTARYIRMYGVERGTPWGYSLWEFGIYDSTLATVPTVPPEDPDRPPDVIGHTAPLPLPEEEQGKEVLALFLGDSDTAQEVEALPEDDLGITPGGDLAQDGLPTAHIVAIHPVNDWIIQATDLVEFFGSAADNDGDGDPGIVAYEWRSDRDGLLSTQQNFTRFGASFSPGRHIISFRAQDNEGNWSEWVRAEIEVQGYSLYLPLILR